MIGKTLGHYQITSQLGKGGMGEVYQAKDQKLGRNVAIKVLPEEFARDADRVARFQREAKVLASLNHPNIAAIYGLEESGGTNFLVLELVEGDTLADRLKRGPIPVEESLKLALQIAEALEAAHEKSIIHRDLKPANIKVTPEGKVKVLDFGLAKAFSGEQAEMNLSNSPTLSDAATQKGVILGTAAYMSPEQAKGKSVDKRADIWAFGAVLLEMLTGRQIFAGETVSETLAAVLMKEADFSTLPPTLHPRIRFLLERCLEKEPQNRYHDISDVRVDIQKVLADPSGVLVQPQIAGRYQSKLRLVFPWVAAAVVAAAILVGAAVWIFKPSEPRQVMRFEYELPEGQQFIDIADAALSVAPDGKSFVYCTSKGLHIRYVDELISKPITGTDGNAQQPFFSPDGKWIGYHSGADQKLKKISINGGAPVTICSDVAGIAGVSWHVDNTIVYSQLGAGIMRISADGGAAKTVIKSISGAYQVAPQVLPDGKSILYTLLKSQGPSIVVQSLNSDKPKELFAGDSGRYLPTGHIVYEVGGNLFAVAFDPLRGETTGSSVSVVEGIFGPLAPQYAVSNSGTLVYIPGNNAGQSDSPGRELVWVDRNGHEESLKMQPKMYRYPRISPDGKKVALTVGEENSDVFIWDIVRKTLTRLTFDESTDAFPIWTVDGKRIAFYSDQENKPGIYWKAADGTGKAEQLCSAPEQFVPYTWAKDGTALIMVRMIGGGMSNQDIIMLSMAGNRPLKPLLQEKYLEIQPRISPDGRWIAYASQASGQNEIFVRPFPDMDKGQWQISTSGGDSPLWSPDGKYLFYLNGDAVVEVPVQTATSFNPLTPKILFRGTYVGAYPLDGVPWDISPDGKRFLMMKPPAPTASAGAGPRKINIVLNWLEELKQRVPVK